MAWFSFPDWIASVFCRVRAASWRRALSTSSSGVMACFGRHDISLFFLKAATAGPRCVPAGTADKGRAQEAGMDFEGRECGP